MDNKKDRKFYWDLKEFVNNNTTNVEQVKKQSLKDVISGVLSENKIYKQNNFEHETDSNQIVSSYLKALSSAEKKNIPNIVHAKNSTINPFNLTEQKKL